MFGKRPAGTMQIASLVGAGSTVSGDLSFKGGLRIDGTVRGSVKCIDGESAGVLVISEHGSVEGEVRAAHLVVSGTINGPVFATELIELQPKARVSGDVHYRALEMHHGAVVEGRLMHESAEKDARSTLKLAVSASGSPPAKSEAARG